MLCFPRRACFLLTALLCASLPAGEARGTAEDKPDPPQNVEAIPQGSDGMLMVWSQPSSSDVDHYYVYVDGTDLEDTTAYTFYDWEVLEACTTYIFGVQTVSSSGVYSDPAVIDGETGVGQPPAPQDLRVKGYTYNSVTLAWEKPDTLCDIQQYRVTYQDDGPLVEETFVTETTVEVSQLKPETFYTFKVYASTSDGEGFAASITQTTEPGPPPEPRGLHVEKTTYNAVTLAWKKPDTLCDIEQYRVTHQEDGTLVEENFVIDTTAEVSQLKPETFYTFKVYAVTSAGEGSAASITQATEIGPGPPQNLETVAISSSAINVTWSEPQVPPDYYLITAYDAFIIEERVFGLQYLIDGLNPCTTCYITVTSVYEDDGSRFDAAAMGETEADIPDPPKSCSVEAHESYITVYWDKPTSHCALGPYSVDWTVKKLWGNFEEESYSINTTGDSLLVADQPLPYHSYTFEIAASVNGIFGDSISCSNTSLETSAGPPVLVSVVSEEEGEVQVTWEPPAEENGQIVQYGIFVNDAPDSVKEVSGEVRTTTVLLQACVSVDISVAARNHADYNDGWGQRSDAKSVTPAGDCESPQVMRRAGRGEEAAAAAVVKTPMQHVL